MVLYANVSTDMKTKITQGQRCNPINHTQYTYETPFITPT